MKCLNCFIPLEQKTNLSHIYFENADFCNIVMCCKGNKILEFSQYKKTDKAPFLNYTDLECLIEKIGGYKNNAEKLSTTKVDNHIPPGFSMAIITSLKNIDNNHDVYRGIDCMKTFPES